MERSLGGVVERGIYTPAHLVRLETKLDRRVLDCEVTIEALGFEVADTPRDRGYGFLRCQ